MENKAQPTTALRMKFNLIFPNIRVRVLLLTFLVLASFTLKFLIVFFHSNYTGHLVSDMGLYWQRSHDRFNGSYFGTDQWYANPPFFPIFLEQFYKVLYFLGLSSHELPMVIFFFIILSSLSVLGVYDITAKLTGGGFWPSFGAAGLYAFCYPIIYFNAFLLTENLAVPLLIGVMWLVITRDHSLGWMVVAGALFGAAVAIRVAVGPIGFFLFLYLWAARPVSWPAFQRASAFSLVFFLVIFFLLVENFFISRGQLRGLAGYFGFNVFLQYCKVRNLYSGSAFYNNPTFIARHPDFGVFHTSHPFNDRNYFLDLVQGCIHNNPHIWIDNLKLFKDVFLYPPWPEFYDVAGYVFWMPAFCYLTLFFTLSIGLYYAIGPKDRLWKSRISLLLSPLFCAMVMCYFFGMEARYLIPCLFGIYAVSFASLPALIKNRSKTDRYLASLVVLFILAFSLLGMQKAKSVKLYGVEFVQEVALAKVAVRVPDGTPGDQWGFFIMGSLRQGILIKSQKPITAHKMEISTDSWDSYQVDFYLENKKKGSLGIPIVQPLKGGTFRRVLQLPEGMKGQKFNRILVRPLQGDGTYSLAYLILDPPGDFDDR